MPDPLSTVVLFIFGTILGSFLNALSFRYNSGKSMWGRSQCMACNKTLSAGELIPVLSYMFLLGKCSACRTRVSLQYPTVEVIAGVLTVLSYYSATNTYTFITTLAFFQILLFIAIYDLRHTIIPDAYVYALSCIGLLMVWLTAGMPTTMQEVTAWVSPYALVAGPLLALPLYLLWYFSHGRAMGKGDSKLFLAVGWFLGLSLGSAAFILSFWVGAIIGVLLMLVSRKYRRGFTMKSELPFGPFIALTAVVVYFLHIDIYTVLSIFALPL